MGAERLLEIKEGDELDGQEESFKSWAKSVFSVGEAAAMLFYVMFMHYAGLDDIDKTLLNPMLLNIIGINF